MNTLYRVLSVLGQYRGIVILGIILVLSAIAIILVVTAVQHFAKQMREQEIREQEGANLKNIDYASLEKEKQATMLRRIIAPDGVDPGPNAYMVVSDGGEDVYVRTLTISRMPRRDRFATTFANLLDFPGCTSSIFIRPIAEENMIGKMDRHITVLSGEYIGARKGGDVNRTRKLEAQINDANNFAAQVENGENRFFSVGFLFTIHASSVKELNKLTSKFRSKALEKNIDVSNCFAVQAEAYLHNAPTNRAVSIDSSMIKNDSVKWFQMDKRSVSALYNYTQTSFTHSKGVVLGRDMFTASPVLFDVYDTSHDGFTIIFAGKTGCGKSASIKMMCCRQLLHGYHFVSIDSQARKGTSEGEYAALAQVCDGVNFQISNKSNEVMNIFEVSESYTTRKNREGEIEEVRDLELADKIIMVVHILKNMVRDGSKEVQASLDMETYIHRILTDNCTQLYKSFGIENGNPDSLFTVPGSALALDKGATSGRIPKRMPTMTDFYKQLLISNRDNHDTTLDAAYNIVLMSLVDFVKELYYSDRTCRFFTKEQAEKLPYQDGGGKGRVFLNDRSVKENVVEIHGIRAYFDGQSSVHIGKDTPFTNIDISQLNENERNLARQVAMDFVNENFIKKNSENLQSSDKLICIFDECHENFKLKYTRDTLDMVSRTARKRNVSLFLCSQTLREYENYPETQAILKQAAAKFIYKQDYQDREFLVKSIGLTPAQADFIVNNLGGNPNDESDKNKHRGETCILDNKEVCFCKFDYREATEAYAVATDAETIEKLFRVSA